MRYSRQSGFTLIEFMVAVAISTIIFGVGLYMITTTQRAQSSTTINIRNAENARMLFDMIERDLAGAYPANYPSFSINSVAQLVKENEPPETIPSDCLQFYTKIDDAFTPDAVTYVRYFVARNAKYPERTTICRQAFKGYLTTVNDFDPPAAINTSNSNDSAVFDGVRSVQYCYRRWLPETKSFDLELSNTQMGNPATATHIIIRLFMYETLADPKKADETNASKVPVNKRPLPRLFQKAIPLPQSFLKKE